MRILIIFFACLVVASCSKSEETANVNIRIENASDEAFKSVLVNTSGGQHTYPSINAQGTSDYRSYTKAYEYAFVEVETIDATFGLQPVDYVGEIPLEDGNYTYILDIIENNGQKVMTLSFRAD